MTSANGEGGGGDAKCYHVNGYGSIHTSRAVLTAAEHAGPLTWNVPSPIIGRGSCWGPKAIVGMMGGVSIIIIEDPDCHRKDTSAQWACG